MKITIHLQGYLPPSHNRIMGEHWSVLNREKRRAALALRRALQSDSSFAVEDLATGTIFAPSSFRTRLSERDFFQMIIGECFKEPLSPRKPRAPKTLEQPS